MMIVIVTICTKEKKTHIHSNNFEQTALYTLSSVSGVIFIFLFLVIFGVGSGTVGLKHLYHAVPGLGQHIQPYWSTLFKKTVNLLVPWTFVRGDKIPIRVRFHILQIRHRSFYISFDTKCNVYYRLYYFHIICSILHPVLV